MCKRYFGIDSLLFHSFRNRRKVRADRRQSIRQYQCTDSNTDKIPIVEKSQCRRYLSWMKLAFSWYDVCSFSNHSVCIRVYCLFLFLIAINIVKRTGSLIALSHHLTIYVQRAHLTEPCIFIVLCTYIRTDESFFFPLIFRFWLSFSRKK